MAELKGVGARFLDELQAHLAPLLKEHDFKKSGRCHYRVHQERRYDVIELRATIYGSAEASRFTIEVYQHDTRKEDPHARRWKKFPTTESNVTCRNIGSFMPSGQQHWWMLDLESDQVALRTEVHTLLAEKVIPFFGSWGAPKKPFIVPAW